MDNLSVFGDIGQMIGYPAMLLIFWLYNKVKEMQKRLDNGEQRFHEQEKETDAVKDSMGAIRSDVSFIRGFIEGKNSVNKEDE
ncbi:MAG: hypothetical protein II819_11465 [Fibrobacter sp.]|nr:hypothetical protein [Fibrobacter sp.]MBQ6770447.1 hypothetical protein [Bacteroidales bacterium]